MSKVIRPVTVGVVQYYRTYVTVDSDMSDEDIRQKVIDGIVESQECGDPDPDMDIEESDVVTVLVWKTVDYSYWDYADDEEEQA